MKGGLYIIYTSLLTISVLSSCAFFILVVSEVLQVEAGANNTTINIDGLQNVSKKVIFPENKVRTPLPQNEQLPKESDDRSKKSILPSGQMTFPETLSLNSVTTDGLPDTGQPPILISLADTAKLQLKKEDELLFVNDSEKHNDTKTFVLVEGKKDAEIQKKEADKVKSELKEATLVVKATPMHEVKKAEEATAANNATPPPTIIAEAAVTESQKDDLNKQNESATTVPIKSETPQEDIPSFSEWAQKQLAEAEKDTVLNHSSQPSHNNVNVSNKGTKLRSKNYASPACGAKIVAVNPEAGSASSILSPNRDEYMLNTCNSRIWFVVELCEAVQAQKIEIANFELFSSTPKEFSVYFSDRFPTREWASVGQFTAKDVREAQSFDLFPHMFGKFIKVEMLSHYGSEHYCPISSFKVFGTSEFEVLEKESAIAVPDEDDDPPIDAIPTAVDADASKNLFGSARDAVMSIMKKAAQVLVKTEVPKNASSQHNDTTEYKNCCSPSHIIVCDNCSQSMYNEVHELISCKAPELTKLVNNIFLQNTLKCTKICQPFGFDFKSRKRIHFGHQREAFVKAVFSQQYLAALCNFLAIKEKKVVLNTSFEAEQNITANATVDKPLNGSTGKTTEEVIKESIANGTVNKPQNKTVEAANIENKTVTPPNKDGEKKPDKIELPIENKEKVDVKKELPTATTTEKPVPEKVVVSVKDKEVPTKDSLESKKDEKPKVEEEKKDEAKTIKPETQNIKDVTGAPEETTDPIFTDSFLTELDQLTVDPTPPGIQNSQNNQNQAQTMQKESVFLRLSNRVKTLERNMSLSGQYLEELSRRYKKQVEEMQKSFEKTVLQMTEERRKSNEREQKYLEQMTTMQAQLGQMASAIKTLMEERDSWFGQITFMKFVILQALTIAVLYYLSKRKKEAIEPTVTVRKKSIKNKKQDKFRRKSVEGVSGHETPLAKKRRPSEEALEIARLSTEELDGNKDLDGDWQIARKNRRRKTSIIHRNCDALWIRQDSIGKLQETPIPLEEAEFLAPVPEPTEFNDEVPQKETVGNGLLNNLKTKAKTRRLSSPAFLRTLSRQSTRNQSSVKKELKFTGNGTSSSPTGSLWSGSTETSQGNRQEPAAKQKKKSFKNIFRKVF